MRTGRKFRLISRAEIEGGIWIEDYPNSIRDFLEELEYDDIIQCWIVYAETPEMMWAHLLGIPLSDWYN